MLPWWMLIKGQTRQPAEATRFSPLLINLLKWFSYAVRADRVYWHKYWKINYDCDTSFLQHFGFICKTWTEELIRTNIETTLQTQHNHLSWHIKYQKVAQKRLRSNAIILHHHAVAPSPHPDTVNVYPAWWLRGVQAHSKKLRWQ